LRSDRIPPRPVISPGSCGSIDRMTMIRLKTGGACLRRTLYRRDALARIESRHHLKRNDVMTRIANFSCALIAAVSLLVSCAKAPPTARSSAMQSPSHHSPHSLQESEAGKSIAPEDLPTIRMYEGFMEDPQENICTITISTVPFYEQGEVDKLYGCDNDEIRSMKLHNLPPGSYVTLYNSPNCGDHDDWQRTTITKWRPGAADIIVSGFTSTGSFMGPGPDPNEFTLYYRSSGSKHGESPRYALAGEVSCMNVYVPGRSP
jgi:hypothetical protein